MKNIKILTLQAQAYIAEHPEASPIDMFIAGCRYADEEHKKLEKEKKKKEAKENRAIILREDGLFAPTFDQFWKAYGYMVDRAKCEALWLKLTPDEKKACMAHVPEYVASTPDLQFRRHPETYLRNKSWNNQIPKKNGNANEQELDFFTEKADTFARLNAMRKPNT